MNEFLLAFFVGPLVAGFVYGLCFAIIRKARKS